MLDIFGKLLSGGGLNKMLGMAASKMDENSCVLMVPNKAAGRLETLQGTFTLISPTEFKVTVTSVASLDKLMQIDEASLPDDEKKALGIGTTPPVTNT